MTMRRRFAQCLLRVGALVGGARNEPVSGANALVIAPHPDDEVFGCGGTIAKKVRAGAAVRVAILTDGRTSHATFMHPADLVRLRQEEAMQAAAALGIAANEYRFLNFPDGELAQHRTRAVAAVAELLQSLRPTEVYVPHARDVQPDHEAACSIVLEALHRYGSPVDLFEYPVWLWHTWPWTWGPGRSSDEGALAHMRRVVPRMFAVAIGCAARIDITDVRANKLAAVRAYRSQMERCEGVPKWPILADVAGGEFLERLLTAEERFRKTRFVP